MNEPAQKQEDEAALDRDADEAIAVCDGDARAALKAVLVANHFLLAEVARLTAVVSRGFTRGKTPARQASEILDDWREITAGKK